METKEEGSLLEKKCVPCRGGIPPLSGEEIERYLEQVDGWTLEKVDGSNRIMKEYDFGEYKSKAYVKAAVFYRKIVEIAGKDIILM